MLVKSMRACLAAAAAAAATAAAGPAFGAGAATGTTPMKELHMRPAPVLPRQAAAFSPPLRRSGRCRPRPGTSSCSRSGTGDGGWGEGQTAFASSSTSSSSAPAAAAERRRASAGAGASEDSRSRVEIPLPPTAGLRRRAAPVAAGAWRPRRKASVSAAAASFHSSLPASSEPFYLSSVLPVPEGGFAGLYLRSSSPESLSGARSSSSSSAATGGARPAEACGSVLSATGIPENEGFEERRQREEKQNFTCNLGEAIDTLQKDVPLLFEQAPNMDIFTPEIVLKDPKGTLSKGKRMYGALFASLRLIGRIAGGGSVPEVRILRTHYDTSKKQVELRLQLTFGTPLLGKEEYVLDANSLYTLDDQGRIYEHTFDNVIKRNLWEYSTNWSAMSAAGSSSAPLSFKCSVRNGDGREGE